MPQSTNLFLFGFVVLVLSLLGSTPFQTTDDLQESEQGPTICSTPAIAPSFNLSSIQTYHKSKKQVDVEVAIHLQHPGIVGLNDQVEYNVTLRPTDDWSAAASKIAAGSAVVNSQAVVTVQFAIPRQDAIAEKSWELEVHADAGPNVGQNSGLDRVYLSFVTPKKDSPTAVLKRPAEYWLARTKQFRQANITIPRIEREESRDFASEGVPWIPTQDLRPQPDDPMPRRRRVPVSIEVVYEDPNGIRRGLADARVELLTEPFTPQSTWAYTLNSAGRASDILVISDDLLPFAAKLYLDDSLFSMKQGPTETNTVLWQFDLNFSTAGGKIVVTGDLVKSIGPDIGHVWSQFHRIRSGGETIVGLQGVPHIDVWFPCSGPSCDVECNAAGNCTGPSSFYRPGGNRIALNTIHTQKQEVLSHEYGHHVFHSWMPGGIPGDKREGDHTLCSTNANDAMAFVEGYPTAFGLKVTGQKTFYGLDFEALSCPTNRDMLTSEGRVAAGMLDLMDTGATPECSGGDDSLGRPSYCDRTSGSLFSPYVVLRQSISGASFASVTKWWESLATSLRGQAGLVDGWEAMRYNYYPLPPCRRRLGRICLDNIIDPPFPWGPPRWIPGPIPPRILTGTLPTPSPDPPVAGGEL